MNINNAIRVVLSSFIVAFIFYGMYRFCVNEPMCKQENGFIFHYNWFLFLAFFVVGVSFTNLCLAYPADIERDEIGFIRYMLQPYSNELYYKNMDAMLNEDNTDWDRYNELQIMYATDCVADYYMTDGSKGYKWTDYYGNVHIYWDYDEVKQ